MPVPEIIVQNRGLDGRCGRCQIIHVQLQIQRQREKLNSCAYNTYGAEPQKSLHLVSSS